MEERRPHEPCGASSILASAIDTRAYVNESDGRVWGAEVVRSTRTARTNLFGRSQGGTAAGFGPVRTWFDSKLPSHACEAELDKRRILNPLEVGSIPTACTNGDVAKWEGGVLQTLYGACSIHAVA
jgi:hypothetical protein